MSDELDPLRHCPHHDFFGGATCSDCGAPLSISSTAASDGASRRCSAGRSDTFPKTWG